MAKLYLGGAQSAIACIMRGSPHRGDDAIRKGQVRWVAKGDPKTQRQFIHTILRSRCVTFHPASFLSSPILQQDRGYRGSGNGIGACRQSILDSKGSFMPVIARDFVQNSRARMRCIISTIGHSLSPVNNGQLYGVDSGEHPGWSIDKPA
jgi:hypothetical protein